MRDSAGPHDAAGGSGCFCRRSSIASASSYDADAYSACAACNRLLRPDVGGPDEDDEDGKSDAPGHDLSYRHGYCCGFVRFDAEPHGRGGGHRRRVVLLAEIGVLEHDLVRADRAAKLPIGVSPTFSPSIHTSAHGVAFNDIVPFGSGSDKSVVLPAKISACSGFSNPEFR